MKNAIFYNDNMSMSLREANAVSDAAIHENNKYFLDRNL